jgi:hypothetical protein
MTEVRCAHKRNKNLNAEVMAAKITFRAFNSKRNALLQPMSQPICSPALFKDVI